MSPQSVGFSPQSSGFAPGSDPREVYMNAYNAATNADFLASSPLPFSSPFGPVYPPHYANNVHLAARYASGGFPVGVAVNNAYAHPQQQPHSQPQSSQPHHTPSYTSPASASNSTDGNLMMSLADYYPQPQPTPPLAPTFGKSVSPVDRQGEATPATTLSADDTLSSVVLETPRGLEDQDGVAVCVPREDGSTATPSSSSNSSQLPSAQQKPFIDRLREAADSSNSDSAPDTPSRCAPVSSTGASATVAQASISSPAVDEVKESRDKEDPNSQAQFHAHPKPVEAQESPFRIAAPQPRAHYTPLDSSPLTSLVASASDVSPAIHVTGTSRTSTPIARSPSVHSRPSSSLSTHSHGRPARTHRKFPPRRFEPSPLRLQLNLTPSMTDSALLEKERERGPLEIDADGHRYRTRSKLKSLRAEMLEREREDDLSAIRKGTRNVRRGKPAEEESLEGSDEDFDMDLSTPQSRLDVLAAISASKRDVDNKGNIAQGAVARMRPKVAASPAPSKGRSSAPPKAKAGTPVPTRSVRPKREAAVRAGQKRPYREVDTDDGETEIDTSGAEASPAPVARRSSKRARTQSSDKASSLDVAGKGKKVDAGEAKARGRATRAIQEKGSPAASPAPRVRAEKGVVKERVRERKVKEKENPRETTVSSDLTEMDDEEAEGKKEVVQSKVKEVVAGSNRPAPAEKLLPVDDSPLEIPTRGFPSGIPVHSAFPLLYRQFPMCGYLDPANPKYVLVIFLSDILTEDNFRFPAPPGPLPGGHFNLPRAIGDLYTPRFVRGVGRDKAGLCPICYESRARGGAGKAEWLSMKFSAFNYHMQYAHGISPTTALPFSPPVAYRLTPRRPNHKNEKTELLEGKCHRCGDWAAVEGVKCVEAKLREIYWWKHAAGCHKGSNIEGEYDWYIHDEVAAGVRAAMGVASSESASMSKARSIMDTPQSVPFQH